ncbi:aldo/keto reductase [Breoghania sp. L-A4]|nr:aldo/keto reductase [Breoghania sp. L-A4]
MRKLGRTGLEVSSLCLGTMTWGEQNSEAEAHAQIDMARERGINFIDTAELYAIPPRPETQGRTEEIVGSWFKRTGRRDEVILATKIVGRSNFTWFRDGEREATLTPEQIEEAVNKSLRRLQTDYIDLYQVHWPDRTVSQFGSNATIWKSVEPAADEVPIEETLGKLGELVQAGKIRHVGLSNESAWGAMRYLQAADEMDLPRVASIQNAYSLINRTFEINLAEVAMREEVGLLAYSVLGQGYLTGKYRDGALPEGSRKKLFDRLQRYETPGSARAVNAYLDLAAAHGLDSAQMALAFAHSRPFVTSVILGATSLQQLSHDIDCTGVEVSEELEKAINAIHQNHGNPCP